MAFKMTPGAPPGLPRDPQESPKRAPRGPKMTPRGPKIAPIWPQDSPKLPQDCLRLPSRAPRNGPRRPARQPQSAPRAPLASHFGFRAPKSAPDHPKISQRCPKDGTMVPPTVATTVGGTLLGPSTFARRLGERTAHYLGPPFAQRVAPNRWGTEHIQNPLVFQHLWPRTTRLPSTMSHNSLSKKAGGGGDSP